MARSQTNGFLFADIRGYTEFVEQRGALAATDLLQRYRQVVRDSIKRHDGAEIRTEGDSFYVVLATASDAVRCALSIVADVAAANADHPRDPIRVGVGVHAGETLETAEGPVGTAVNLAARLCALAAPGEVLVSDTVRGLARSVVEASFVARGTQRFKGLAEPVAVYAAQPLGAVGPVPTAARGRRLLVRRSLPIGLVVAVLVAVLLIAYAAMGRVPGAPSASPTAGALGTSSGPTASAAVATVSSSPASSAPGLPTPAVVSFPPDQPGGIGIEPSPLAAGEWRFSSFQPQLTFKVDPAWSDRWWYGLGASADGARLFAGPYGVEFLTAVTGGLGVHVNFARPQTVLGDSCDPGDSGANQLIGADPQDFVKWLQQNSLLTTSQLQPIVLAGWRGLSIDAAVNSNQGDVCGLPPGTQRQIYLYRNSGTSIESLLTDETARFIVLDVGESAPLVVWTQAPTGKWARYLPWAQQFIDTINQYNP